VLQAGGSAVDAVEAAVVALEDEPLFNAGKGAVGSSTCWPRPGTPPSAAQCHAAS
jgi:hypothetical protein